MYGRYITQIKASYILFYERNLQNLALSSSERLFPHIYMAISFSQDDASSSKVANLKYLYFYLSDLYSKFL